MKITDVTCKCKSCDWTGIVEDCESGPDGDLLCPLCLGNVRVIMTDVPDAAATKAVSEKGEKGEWTMTFDYEVISNEIHIPPERKPMFPPRVQVHPGGWIAHVHCDGARWHVLSWNSLGRHCSEPNCIVNKPKA